MSLFQSNLRKQIRNLLKILNYVKKIHYYSKLFTSLLSADIRGSSTGKADRSKAARRSAKASDGSVGWEPLFRVRLSRITSVALLAVSLKLYGSAVREVISAYPAQ